jgi:hypothetical protein
MSVMLTNVTGKDLEVDDGRGGMLVIPAGHTVAYLADIASDDVRRLLASSQLKIEDEGDFRDVDDDC